jgi:hypothetical protein
LYRDWQTYLLAQIKENFQYLTYRETPIEPEKQTLQLVREISKVNHLPIQLLCVALYKMLLLKFTQLEIIEHSVEQLCRMFLSTNDYTLALAILQIFHELSPLQMKLFDSVRYVRLLLDVEHHLARFYSAPGLRDEERRSRQSELFGLFEKIVGLLGDRELSELFRAGQQQFAAFLLAAPAQSAQAQQSAALVAQEELRRQQAADQFDEEVAVYRQKFHGPRSSSASSSGEVEAEAGELQAGGKRWNLARLSSLLLSEDWRVRVFSLENLKKLLKASHAAATAHALAPVPANPLPSPRPTADPANPNPALTSRSPNPSQPATSRRPSARDGPMALLLDELPPPPPTPTGPGQPSQLPEEPLDGLGGLEGGGAGGGRWLRFSDDEQFAGLARALLQSLQRSIKGRPQGERPGRHQAPQNGQPTASQKTHGQFGQLSAEQLQQLSTAGRLAYLAMRSAETDLGSVQLIFDCLGLLFSFPARFLGPAPTSSGEEELQRGAAGPFNPLLGRYLTAWQLVFVAALREFHRLLFTLSHAAEFAAAFPEKLPPGPHRDLLEAVAERSALFFSLVLFAAPGPAPAASLQPLGGLLAAQASLQQNGRGEGRPSGWRCCQLPLERPTLRLSLRSEGPSCRLFMALSFLRHLLATHLASSSSAPAGPAATAFSDGHPQVLSARPSQPQRTAPGEGGQLVGRDFLNDFFAADGFGLVASLWLWAAGPTGRSNLFLRRLAAQVLAQAAALNDVALALWRLDPVPRLLGRIAAAFRRKNRPLASARPIWSRARQQQAEKAGRAERQRTASTAASSSASAAGPFTYEHAALFQREAVEEADDEDEAAEEEQLAAAETALDSDSDDLSAEAEAEPSAASSASSDDSSLGPDGLDFDLFDDDEAALDGPPSAAFSRRSGRSSGGGLEETAAQARRRRRVAGRRVKIEVGLLRPLLTLLDNLLQAAVSREFYSAANRRQLADYLAALKVGDEKRRHFFLLREVAERKAAVGLYFGLVLEACDNPSHPANPSSLPSPAAQAAALAVSEAGGPSAEDLEIRRLLGLA